MNQLLDSVLLVKLISYGTFYFCSTIMKSEINKRILTNRSVKTTIYFILFTAVSAGYFTYHNPLSPQLNPLVEAILIVTVYISYAINIKIILGVILTNIISKKYKHNPVMQILAQCRVYRDFDNDVEYIVFLETKRTKTCVISFESYLEFVNILKKCQTFSIDTFQTNGIPSTFIDYLISNEIIVKNDNENYVLSNRKQNLEFILSRTNALRKILDKVSKE